MSKLIILIFTVLLLTTGVSSAEPIVVSGDDNIHSILQAQKGKRVTLNMKSGRDLTGTVAMVNEKVVHIKQLSGREFFDAVVGLGKIEAIQIRVKQ